MSKRFLLSIVLLLAMVLASCAPAATPTEAPAAEPVQTEAPVVEPVETEAPVVEEPTEAPAVEPTEEPAPVEAAGTLRIWADDTRAPILEDMADEVLATYAVELVVELKSAIRDDFQVAAPLGEGPDLIAIAHDQAGAVGLQWPVSTGRPGR